MIGGNRRKLLQTLDNSFNELYETKQNKVWYSDAEPTSEESEDGDIWFEKEPIETKRKITKVAITQNYLNLFHSSIDLEEPIIIPIQNTNIKFNSFYILCNNPESNTGAESKNYASAQVQIRKLEIGNDIDGYNTITEENALQLLPIFENIEFDIKIYDNIGNSLNFIVYPETAIRDTISYDDRYSYITIDICQQTPVNNAYIEDAFNTQNYKNCINTWVTNSADITFSITPKSVDILKLINCGIFCTKPLENNEYYDGLQSWVYNYNPVSKWNTIIGSAAKILDYLFSTYKIRYISSIFSMIANTEKNLIKNFDNTNISNYDTSLIVNMSSAFKDQSLLTELNLQNWDFSSVDYMNELCDGCTNLRKFNAVIDMDNVYMEDNAFRNCPYDLIIHVINKPYNTTYEDLGLTFSNQLVEDDK